MPELPDILTYIDAMDRFLSGQILQHVTVRSPFVLRTFEPDISQAEGRRVLGFRRLGKRIAWELEGDFFLVFHLMISGRFHWKKPRTKPRAKTDLIAFQFDHGVIMLTEASTKKRASLYAVQGAGGLQEHHPSGLELLTASEEEFKRVLLRENHTAKRDLTDPKLFSGIGNAYSYEILHGAQLSPLKWTSRLTDNEISRLFQAVITTLTMWSERLLADTGDDFPEKVTAFRPEMAVHGKAQQPCPVCGTMVQRIAYADNETNYCPRCQTDGKLLADRSLSRLLRDDWPKSLDELEGQ
jgi:formamidopyrimidine-DNA glycosylase